MLRSRFFWKLFAGYVVLVLSATVLIGASVETTSEQDLEERITVSLRSDTFYLAQLARDQLDGSSNLELQRRVAEVARRSGSRLTVLDRAGEVLADSHFGPESAGAPRRNRLDRPEIQACRREMSAVERRFSATLGEECLYAALRVPPDAAEPEGYVRASRPTAIIAARTRRLRETLIAGAATALVAGLLAGLMFARRVTARLTSMTSAVETMSRGGYGHMPVPDEADEIGRLAEAFNDMSDQLRERVATITTDRAKLLSILRSMVEGLIATDDEQRIVHLNVVAGQLLGVNPANCVGQPALDALPHPALWDILREVRERDLQHELRVEVEVDENLIEVRASALIDSTGSRAGALLVLNDVTELRQLERMRQDFVTNASHELKTPLTSVLGYVETLLDDPDIEPATGRRFLEKIRSHSLRQSKLVSDLLNLARIESPQTARHRSVLDLRTAVRSAHVLHSPTCRDLDLELSLRLPHGEVPVWANDEDLRQILDNLLGNAAKFTPAGGHIELALSVEGDEAVIEVTDTGLGIAPEDSERVFERFYRADKARSRELGGTGLGLAIVKHLTLGLGGEASVTSEPGVGSTFRIRLPVHRGQE